MKKNLSVLALIAQNTLYQILGILAAMAAVELILFYHKFTTLSGSVRVEEILSGTFPAVFTGSATGVFLVIMLFYAGKNSRITRHTLYRLSISPVRFFAVNTVYTTGCTLLLIALHLLVAWVCCQIYAGQAAGADAAQITFLAFYRTELHLLLPLANTSGYLRNFTVILLWGLFISSPVLRKGGAFNNEKEKSDDIEAGQPSV